MPQALTRLRETPSQTGGPYVHIGLVPNFCSIGGLWTDDLGAKLVNDRTRGDRISVSGQVLDGLGMPVDDCIVEVWQADAEGLYPSPAETRGDADPDFAGWGRCPADASGIYRFETIKPGRVPTPAGRLQAPHISFWIVARGINLGLNTRLYFDDEAAANAEDPILTRIEHTKRRQSLVAARDGNAYRFDIRLQGPDETVFFDI